MKSLTSIIFKNETRRDIGTNDGIKGKMLSALSFIIVFGALAGFMIWASIYITKRLETINQPYAFINIMLLGNFLILFFESIFQVLNSLYFSKDLKILLRMPIKSRQIIHSKLIKLITAEYQMEIIMLAIPMIVYGIIYQVSFLFYLYVIGILIILPVIPISITACIIAIIMRFTNLMKNKSKVMYVTIVLALIVLNIVLALTGGQVSILKLFDKQILMTENGIANEITKGFKLIKPIMDSLQNYNSIFGLKSFAMYIIESIMIYIVTILLISPIYLKGCIGTIVNSNKNKLQRNFELKIEDFKRKSYKKAYLDKELKTIKRTPIFFIQCIIMPLTISIFILVVAVIFIFTANYIPYNLKFAADISWIAGGVLSAIQILYMLNFSSIIAISKEEKSAIISKYLPIKFNEQLRLKMITGQIINLITGIGISALYYAFTNNIIYGIVILIISIIISLITEKIKIIIDLKNPRIKWDSEYAMMKQNTNVMYELFYTMAFILLFIILGIIIKNIKLYFAIVSIITFIVNIRIGQYLKNNDSKIFERLY